MELQALYRIRSEISVENNEYPRKPIFSNSSDFKLLKFYDMILSKKSGGAYRKKARAYEHGEKVDSGFPHNRWCFKGGNVWLEKEGNKSADCGR